MLKNSKKIKNRKQNGFTLIEALVAIAILTVSIAGPITIASKGLASAVFARDQITAFYLAQEAVEFIRNQRDENNIKGGNWLAGLNVCSNGSACTIDVQNNNIKNCPGDVCDVLKYDDNTNFYNYSTGDDSIFTRKVSMTDVNSKEVAINVTLSWNKGSSQRMFSVREHIFDW